MVKTRSVPLILVLLFIFQLINTAWAAPAYQDTTQTDKARALLETLSPEERVGQLFLVTFTGMKVESDTQIYDLIVNHHVGGVILLSDNDNFTFGEDAIDQILLMNRQLQLTRWSSSQAQQVNSATGEVITPKFIPLFVGASQEGDGYPYDHIINGVTVLPNEMALGATWNSGLAEQTGSILGKELAALGINLLLGPSLDVLETPQPEGSIDLGTRTFGGDPFWVGEMGSAFVSGVHEGSRGKMAVIAKHFPGNGGSDRPPEEEVATVRKSLEQLKNFDLAPFFAVTGNAASPQATVDGLLASHIRYQGFQENIRATTRPVSFDQQAFSLLLSLPALSTWRENGGVMVSDSLGSKAVRRFYELTNPTQPFDPRRVALNAFLAGNDQLYLGNIQAGDDPDSYTSTVRTLEFFAQKYREDSAFAARVDESVLRVLTLKYRLYPTFNLAQVLPLLDGAEEVGQPSQVTFEVAQQAATLISPTLAELNDAMPDPPDRTDRIVFITDVRTAAQCSQCPQQEVLAVDAMQQAVIRLYGPQASSQVNPASLSSYSFENLNQMLDDPQEETEVEKDLTRAHWIIFGMLNETNEIPASQALRRFLSERPDLFRQKRLIAFAFNAPYYLDATNISKITAYYGLYSKAPPFIDVAARLLFRELSPTGDLPVSVPGIGYDLISATSPDSTQIIPLFLDLPVEGQPNATTPQPTPTQQFRIGNLIPVKTGVILDHNGHPVPDGTPVQFIISVGGVQTAASQLETTSDGVAHTTVQVTSPGTWEVRAESEPAKQSDLLRFDIPPEDGGTQTVTASPSPTETLQPTLSPTPVPVVTEVSEPPRDTRPNLVDWFVAIFVAVILGMSSYRLSALVGQVRWGVRGGFLALIGGLLFYSYLALGLPGSEFLIEKLAGWGVILVTLIGSGLGILAAWGWRMAYLNHKAAN